MPILRELDPAWEPKPRSLDAQRTLDEVQARLQEQAGVVARLARELASRCAELTAAINALAKEIAQLVEQLAPALLALPGLLLAVQTGLRVSELIGLNCADVTLGDGANVRCEGKGRKHRAVPLTGPVINLIHVWLTERAGRPGDPLFCTRTGRRLSRDAVALRVHTHAETATERCPSLAGKESTRTCFGTAAP